METRHGESVTRQEGFLTDHFLIATPMLVDPHFARSLTYIFRHNADGAAGVIVNRATPLRLGELLQSLGIEQEPLPIHSDRVLYGGPVEVGRGLVLYHSSAIIDCSQPHSENEESDGVSVSSSLETLQGLLQQEPKKWLVALGYAGWEAGQLEAELAENTWLICPARSEILFSTPVERRLPTAAAALGLDLSRLAPYAGHG